MITATPKGVYLDDVVTQIVAPTRVTIRPYLKISTLKNIVDTSMKQKERLGVFIASECERLFEKEYGNK